MESNSLRNILRLFLFVVALGSHAAHLKVAVPVGGYAPLSYDDSGILKGLSVDVWKEIAERKKISYKLIPVEEDMETLYQKLSLGKYDVLLGPVAVDASMIDKITYTLPYFLNHGAILTYKKKLSMLDLMHSLFSDYIKHVLLFYILFLAIYFHVILFVERRTSMPSEIPKQYREGILFLIGRHFPFQNMFFSVKKDKWSHVLYIIYFYVHGPFVAILSGAIASLLTVVLSQNHKVLLSNNDLTTKKFAYIEGRPVYDALAEKLHMDVVVVPSLEKAIELIKDYKVDGLIEDKITLESFIKTEKIKDMDLAPFQVGYILYSMALSPRASKNRAEINKGIVDLHLSGSQAMIAQKYGITDKKLSLLYY